MIAIRGSMACAFGRLTFQLSWKDISREAIPPNVREGWVGDSKLLSRTLTFESRQSTLNQEFWGCGLTSAALRGQPISGGYDLLLAPPGDGERIEAKTSPLPERPGQQRKP